MKIDITYKITKEINALANSNEQKTFSGHLGTHFDVMNKVFPLAYTERKAVVFDVSNIKGRDIELSDIDTSLIDKDIFVLFYTGFIEKVGYGNTVYYKEHPQLSNELIDYLLAKKVSMIGVDFAGIRRGKEHVLADQRCADNGCFVIENLCNLKEVLKHGDICLVHTYPLSYEGLSGLPCRVIAEFND